MADMERIWGKDGRFGRLDYVTAWYRKAVDCMEANPAIKAAFVSTNSISQGEQVGILWSDLLARGVFIHFAHRTFQDRKSVVQGKSVSVRVDLGGRRLIKQKTHNKTHV